MKTVEEIQVLRPAVWIVIVVLAVAVVMTPRPAELWRRMALDQEDLRLKRRFDRDGDQMREMEPTLHAWVKQVLIPGLTKDTPPEGKAREALEETLEARASGLRPEKTAKRLGQLLVLLPPEEARAWVVHQSFSKEEWRMIHQGALASLLDRRAFSQLEELERVLLARFDFSVEDGLHWVDYWKWKGGTTSAYDALRRYRGAIPEEQVGALIAGEMKLLREMNRNAEAFDLGVKLLPRLRGAPEEAEFMVQLVQCAEQGQHVRELIPWYEQWAERNPDSGEIWSTYARIALAVGEMERGGRALDRAIALVGAKPEQRFLRAQIHEWAGKPDLAFDLYLALLKEGEMRAIPRILALYPGLFRIKEAALALDQAVGVDQDHPYLLSAANLLVRVGDYARAVDRFRQYAQFHPGDLSAWTTLYELFLLRDDLEGAQRTVEQGLRYHPNSMDLKIKRVEVALARSQMEEALRMLDRLVFEDHSVEMVDSYLALETQISGGRSRESAIRALTKGNLDRNAALILAAFLEGTEDSKLEIDWLEEQLKRSPEDPAIHTVAARFFLKKGDRLRAQASLDKVPDWNSKDPVLGLEILATAENPARALVALRGVESEIGERRDLTRIAAGIYVRAGQFYKAMPLYQQMYEENPEDVGLVAEYALAAKKIGQDALCRQLLGQLERSEDLVGLRVAATLAHDLGLRPESIRLSARLTQAAGSSAQDWIDAGQRMESHRSPRAARQLFRGALQKLTHP